MDLSGTGDVDQQTDPATERSLDPSPMPDLDQDGDPLVVQTTIQTTIRVAIRKAVRIVDRTAVLQGSSLASGTGRNGRTAP